MLRRVCLVRSVRVPNICIILYRFTEVALEREAEGDLFLHDIGQGLGFRPGSFDGAIRCVSFILNQICDLILL